MPLSFLQQVIKNEKLYINLEVQDCPYLVFFFFNSFTSYFCVLHFAYSRFQRVSIRDSQGEKARSLFSEWKSAHKASLSHYLSEIMEDFVKRLSLPMKRPSAPQKETPHLPAGLGTGIQRRPRSQEVQPQSWVSGAPGS